MHSDFRAFALAPSAAYNRITLQTPGGARQTNCVGLIELEAEAGKNFLTRFDLRLADIFIDQEKGFSLSGFLTLSDPFVEIDGAPGEIAQGLRCILGAAVMDENREFATAEIKVEADLKYEGCTMTGRISGQVPDDFPYAAGARFDAPLLAHAQGFGRFIARFDSAEAVSDARLSIAADGWRKEVLNPEAVDMLIPAHSTITLDWNARDAQSGEIRRERDILADIVLTPGQSTDLEFSLFEPGVLPVLGSAVLAQERGAKAKLDYDLRPTGDKSGAIEIRTRIEGTPGRFVLVDAIVASTDPARAYPGFDAQGYITRAHAGVLSITSCGLDPTGPNTPGANPVLSNPPGGAGGVPDAPPPPPPDEPPSTPGPNSSTSDGGNTCDANYGATLPPSGILELLTIVEPIRDDQAEIALVGVFANGHKIRNGRVALETGGQIEERRFNPVWLTDRRIHRVSVELPRGRSLRRVDTLPLAVDLRERVIAALALRQPCATHLRDGLPQVVGDLGNGLDFEITGTALGRAGLRISLNNSSGGWVAIPETLIGSGKLYAEGKVIASELETRAEIHDIAHRIVFVPAGIATLHA